MNTALESNVQWLNAIVLRRNGLKIDLASNVTYDVQTLYTTGYQGVFQGVKPLRKGIEPTDYIEAADEKELCVIQIGPTQMPDTLPEDGSDPPPQPQVFAMYLLSPEQPTAGPCGPTPVVPS